MSGRLHRRNQGILWPYLAALCQTVLITILRLLNHLPFRQFLCFFSVHTLCRPSSPCSPTRSFLLNPQHHQELTVVLDLDETLICAYDAALLPEGLHNHAVHGGLNWFHLQCLASANSNDRGRVKIDHVIVYERPGLREFLERASQFAELVLFTAGLEGYARPLIDRIDPDNCISARLYRPATVLTKYREHVKDLSRLGRDLKRTVIIDNNPFSFLLQPSNGVPCVPFTAQDPNDSQLLDVLLPLLELLSSEQDVRPVLHERFQMVAWFRNRGVLTGPQSL